MEQARRVQDLSPAYEVLSFALNVWIWSEVIVLLFNRRKRALHDFIAGTVVVHSVPSTSSANRPWQALSLCSALWPARPLNRETLGSVGFLG